MNEKLIKFELLEKNRRLSLSEPKKEMNIRFFKKLD
jgi:hypothetical protein